MNLSQIKAEVGRLLNDPNHSRWTEAVITTRANLAQTEIMGFTKAVITKATLTPTVSTSAVSVDSDTMDVDRVTIQRSNGDVYQLTGRTIEELDYTWPNWRQWTDGEPQVYWWNGTDQQINLVPAPDAGNVITNGITVWEVRNPAALSSDSDVPFDSYSSLIPYHMSIVHWVVAQCWMDDATPEALSKAKFHKSGMMDRPGEYEKQVQRILETHNKPEDIPVRILQRPQGGRVGSWGPSKANPLNI